MSEMKMESNIEQFWEAFESYIEKEEDSEKSSSSES